MVRPTRDNNYPLSISFWGLGDKLGNARKGARPPPTVPASAAQGPPGCRRLVWATESRSLDREDGHSGVHFFADLSILIIGIGPLWALWTSSATRRKPRLRPRTGLRTITRMRRVMFHLDLYWPSRWLE